MAESFHIQGGKLRVTVFPGTVAGWQSQALTEVHNVVDNQRQADQASRYGAALRTVEQRGFFLRGETGDTRVELPDNCGCEMLDGHRLLGLVLTAAAEPAPTRFEGAIAFVNRDTGQGYRMVQWIRKAFDAFAEAPPYSKGALVCWRNACGVGVILLLSGLLALVLGASTANAQPADLGGAIIALLIGAGLALYGPVVVFPAARAFDQRHCAFEQTIAEEAAQGLEPTRGTTIPLAILSRRVRPGGAIG